MSSGFIRSFLTGLCISLYSFSALAQPKYIPREHDWFSYDISTLILQNAPAGLEQEGWSNGHTFSFMKDVLLGKSNFSIGVGLAYTSNNYKTNVRLAVDETTGDASFTLLNSDSTSYNKNKFNAKYVEIPVELRFRTRPDDNGRFLRIYLGARGGIRFSGYSLFENDQAEVRYYHPQELNRWIAGTYVRLGYGAISVYGYYSLTPVFDYSSPAGLPVNQVDMNKTFPIALGLSLSI